MARMSLGNVDPTSEEVAKMIEVMNVLSGLLKEKGHTTREPKFNQEDGTVEMFGGGRAVAWIDQLHPKRPRHMGFWRHPVWRYESHDNALVEARRERGLW